MDWREFLKPIYCGFCLVRIEIVEWDNNPSILELMYPKIKFKYTKKYYHGYCIQRMFDVASM